MMELISFVLGGALVLGVALWYIKYGDDDAL